jgi:hypothetical protein
MTITPEQLQALQDKVNALTADQASLDQATKDNDAAHAALTTAQMDVAAKDASWEAKAAKVLMGLTDLKSFVDSLVNPTPPTPPPPAPTPS